MLWFGSGMSLKDSCVEDLVLNATAFRGGAFRKGLDQGHSSLIS